MGDQQQRTHGRTAVARAHGRASDDDGQSTWASGGGAFLHIRREKKTVEYEVHWRYTFLGLLSQSARTPI
jgi:hypothetical protein